MDNSIYREIRVHHRERKGLAREALALAAGACAGRALSELSLAFNGRFSRRGKRERERDQVSAHGGHQGV